MLSVQQCQTACAHLHTLCLQLRQQLGPQLLAKLPAAQIGKVRKEGHHDARAWLCLRLASAHGRVQGTSSSCLCSTQLLCCRVGLKAMYQGAQ